MTDQEYTEAIILQSLIKKSKELSSNIRDGHSINSRDLKAVIPDLTNLLDEKRKGFEKEFEEL